MTQPKCKHCGKAYRSRAHFIASRTDWHTFQAEPKPARLTIQTSDCGHYAGLYLDGKHIKGFAESAPAARAAAEAHKAELLAHFRSGGE